METYAVLTRLPSGLAVTGPDAVAALTARFPRASLALGARARAALPKALAAAGVSGGAAYDGLIALEADAHGRSLVTLDIRAQATYRRLGLAFRALQTNAGGGSGA